jgi:hypothetical protein
MYLQCNCSLMFSHKHQNMYVRQDTAFPNIENTNWMATPVTCCYLTTIPSKIHCLCIYNVTVVLCFSANTRTCICGKILCFRTSKTQSVWLPLSHAVTKKVFHQKHITYEFTMYLQFYVKSQTPEHENVARYCISAY